MLQEVIQEFLPLLRPLHCVSNLLHPVTVSVWESLNVRVALVLVLGIQQPRLALLELDP